MATSILIDNQSGMAMAWDPVFHARTKHIEIHYHYVRHRLHVGEIILAYFSTHDNINNLFIKALSREKSEVFRKALVLLSFGD